MNPASKKWPLVTDEEFEAFASAFPDREQLHRVLDAVEQYRRDGRQDYQRPPAKEPL
jgi:hypothetical protein